MSHEGVDHRHQSTEAFLGGSQMSHEGVDHRHQSTEAFLGAVGHGILVWEALIAVRWPAVKN